ncbi:MAG: hypothetical protein ACFBSF_22565 [Leptolyngbyaceae cyanobacterium]
MLNPDFAVFDIEVEDAALDAAFVGPADMDNLVAILAVRSDGFQR